MDLAFDYARRLYAEIPEHLRNLDGLDLTPANHACPYGLDVAELMQRANKVLKG